MYDTSRSLIVVDQVIASQGLDYLAGRLPEAQIVSDIL